MQLRSVLTSDSIRSVSIKVTITIPVLSEHVATTKTGWRSMPLGDSA
jgi:hypothetical protein